MKFIKKLLNGKEKETVQAESAISHKTLTAKDIAEKLGVERRKFERAIIDLGWAERSGTRGAIATDKGKKHGARTRMHDMSQNKYVVWNESILDNSELKEALAE